MRRKTILIILLFSFALFKCNQNPIPINVDENSSLIENYSLELEINENNKISEIHHTINGLKNGVSLFYDLTGRLQHIVKYKNDTIDGVAISFATNNISRSKRHVKNIRYYKKGLLQDKSYDLHYNGLIAGSLTFLNDTLTGEYIIYDQIGMISKYLFLDKNEVVFEINYSNDTVQKVQGIPAFIAYYNDSIRIDEEFKFKIFAATPKFFKSSYEIEVLKNGKKIEKLEEDFYKSPIVYLNKFYDKGTYLIKTKVKIENEKFSKFYPGDFKIHVY